MLRVQAAERQEPFVHLIFIPAMVQEIIAYESWRIDFAQIEYVRFCMASSGTIDLGNGAPLTSTYQHSTWVEIRPTTFMHQQQIGYNNLLIQTGVSDGFFHVAQLLASNLGTLQLAAFLLISLHTVSE